MEYTYITSKDLPSEILQAPCMVCACILTLANLNNVINHRTATTTEWPRIPTNSTPLFQPILILSFLHFIIWNLYQKKAEFRWQ